MALTDLLSTDVINALVVILLAIIAYLTHQTKTTNAQIATASVQTAVTNQAMAAATVPAATTPGIYVPTDTRIPGTTQVGSQYWMDAGYTGPEPDAATKAAYSDAVVAYNAAVAQAQALAKKYGDTNISAPIKALIPKT